MLHPTRLSVRQAAELSVGKNLIRRIQCLSKILHKPLRGVTERNYNIRWTFNVPNWIRTCNFPNIFHKSYRKTQSPDSWIKIDQLDITCFISSLFTAQHVSNVSTSIFRSLRLIVDLFHVLYCSGSMCVGVTVWFFWGGVVSLFRLKH